MEILYSLAMGFLIAVPIVGVSCGVFLLANSYGAFDELGPWLNSLSQTEVFLLLILLVLVFDGGDRKKDA